MKLKKIISLSMITAMVMTTTSVNISFATQNDTKNKQATVNVQVPAEVKNKSEVVYGKLSTDGSISAVYVVNHFELAKSGSIIDYGNYKTVQNLTESKPIEINDDAITFQAEAGDFYYQGNMETTDLPWIFDITYELDGELQTSQSIAGKSGEVGIYINTKKNEKVNASFFENYMLQISLTLDSDKCSNINAPDATIADAGNNTMLAYTVMPNKNADFKLTADVTDFAMSGIEISAIPFSLSLDLPDAEGMLSDLEKLPLAISELNDGVGKLADGTTELKNGASDLENGSDEFKSGLSKLKQNSTQITGASSQIKSALTKISSSLSSGTSGADLSSLTQLPTALGDLSKGLKGISGGLSQLKEGYATAYSALDLTIKGIPDIAITQDQLNKQFSDANDSQRILLDQLYASYLAGQTVKGTYQQVKQAFASVAPSMESMSANIDKISGALDEISSKLGDSLSSPDMSVQLEQLSKGLTELANQYSEFDKGLYEYMQGVGKLSDGYVQFDTGLTKFANGVDELNTVVSKLYEGTDELNTEISKMPEKIDEEIDNLMEEYIGSDFELISYVSSKNTNTGLVQFVLKSDDIKLPEQDKTNTEVADESTENETVWDRFVALFQKD